MPELINTLKAVNKRDYENKKFQASLKGVDLGEYNDEGKKGSSFEEIELRAAGITTSPDDVVSLQGRFAAQAGFGIGEGLGYAKE
jgi:V8-like Glu-specific endopeptidase